MRRVFAFVVLVLICIAGEAVADARVFSTAPSGDFEAVQNLWRSQQNVPMRLRPLGLSASSPLHLKLPLEDGVATVTFSGIQFRTWESSIRSESGESADLSDIVLLQGSVQLPGASHASPAAGAIYEKDGARVIRVTFQREQKAGLEGLDVVVPLDNVSSARVSVADFSELKNRACGMLQSSRNIVHSEVASSGTVGIAAAAKSVELATDADYEWYSRFGSSSNTEIAAAINTVNTIYESELGLTLSIVQQHAWSTSSQPFSSTDSETLLVQFQDYTNLHSHLGAADLYHLFSGKNFDGSTIGIAYMGVTCDAPSYSYGTTSYVGELTYAVAAHEVGHNFNADHDTNLPATIMYPSLGGNEMTFSSLSRNQISTFLAGGGSSCLTDTTLPDPRLDPSILTVSLSPSLARSTGTFAASVSVARASSLSCSLIMEMSKKRDMSSPVKRRVGNLVQGVFTMIGRASSRVRVASREPAEIYLRASVVCATGQTGKSSVKRIRPTASTSRTVPSRLDWMRQLARSLRKY